ncbi:DeoR/GlpR family DNA-binding transcription regulator [Jatrophihabitans endophyticus]|uniref:DeoR/GlpR family DNA-binding transcription regulator n=1 Tax=Jatrophihabitans endophyticus TaxID=1206085 RepID=UPI0019EB14D8|nr:DeoR/GlpR family DNA-binding transcription regulator [Jatrophihabitans endophyticus]MBE7190564.1 DeoR/GlpR transcriptional regulator [Jatrophihabitans endophyticus]
MRPEMALDERATRVMRHPGDDMLIPDRLQRIRAALTESGSVRIDDLVHSLGVSAWTVRRDLAELERQGELRRTHGGAYLEGHTPPTNGADVDDDATRAAKLRIGAAAAAQLDDGSTVMVLAGSTTGALVPVLARRRLTVVTNGLEIAHGLRHAPDISLVVVGGYLHREQMTLLGPLSEAAMADLHVDVIVAGAYGVHPQVGVTGAKILQAGYHHSMLRHTDRLMVVADSSKIGRRGPTVLASAQDVGTLVTDTGAPGDTVDELRAAGVDVQLV